LYSVQQDFQVAGALCGGVSGETVVLATVIVAERDQSEYAKNTDVGDVLQLYDGTIPACV
jgi:hypothetical protein